MHSEIMKKRQDFFKARLYELTLHHYEQAKLKFKESPQQSEFIELIDPIEHKQWPHFFEVHQVEDIPLALLQEQPKVHKTQTIKDFIDETSANLVNNNGISATKIALQLTSLESNIISSKKEVPNVENVVMDDGDLSMSTVFATAKTATTISSELSKTLSSSLLHKIQSK